MQDNIEKTNLEAHVSLCALRYQQLEHRIAAVEVEIKEIKTLMHEIHQSLLKVPEQSNVRWLSAQTAVIGVLLGVSGWALARLFV
jgi:hypothetical protein